VFSALAHLSRLADALYVFAREGVLGIPDPSGLPGPARALLRVARLLERRSAAAGAVRLAAALTRLGPTYVKLGQFLATRPDLVGLALSRDLETLQDKMAPFPQAVAEAEIAAALGRPLEEEFAYLGPAVAAASIAQVHRAEIVADGVRRPVAVKVLRPHIEARFRADLASFRFAARWAESVSAEARRLRLCEIVDTLARSVTLEMDLRLEAAAIAEMAGNIAHDADFRVPAVDWTRTAKGVLTLEWIDATPLSDRAALRAKGYDLARLGRALMQSFLRHALRDGFFHADLHPGNLFVDADGRLIAVDFGIMGRLGPKERRFLAEILYGFLTRNYRRTAEVHFEAGYVPTRHSVESFAQALRAIGEPIHSRTAAEISMARTLTLLFEVTGLFDMQTRPELLLLQKTMVVVEGVARSLDPELDMWRTSDPVVRDWIERHLGPVGRIEDAARGAGEIGKALAALPALIVRVADLADQFAALGPEILRPSPPAAADAERRRRRALLVVLSALVVGLGVALLWRL
jgi:ubiquinone biosynthesis protein